MILIRDNYYQTITRHPALIAEIEYDLSEYGRVNFK